MKKKESHSGNGKLYYVESDTLATNGKEELFTWKDACEIARYCQNQHPEERYMIREFEPI